MANTGTIKVDGSSFKIKKERSFFGGTLTLTKEGWVVRPDNYTLLSGFYPTQHEAEEALVGWLREENLRHARSELFPKAPGCRREKTRECRPSTLSERELRQFLMYLLGCPPEIDEAWYESQIHIWLKGQRLEQLAFASYGPNDIDGGQAVAVRVDSLGRAVEYLSFSDYILGGFELPEGDWHYFV